MPLGSYNHVFLTADMNKLLYSSVVKVKRRTVNVYQNKGSFPLENGGDNHSWSQYPLRLLEYPRVVIFADIIKILTTFIKTIFKDLKKVKRIRNYVPKSNLHLYFLM